MLKGKEEKGSDLPDLFNPMRARRDTIHVTMGYFSQDFRRKGDRSSTNSRWNMYGVEEDADSKETHSIKESTSQG